MFKILEELNTFSPLGMRFWDPVLEAQIRDQLIVTAKLEEGPGKAVNAYRTASDVYAFNNLPQTVIPSPNFSYIVEVEDLRRRYVKVAIRVRLPLGYLGVYLSSTAFSSPQSSPRGFHLYSALTRRPPSMFAALRAELEDFATGNPASHAVLRVRTPDGKSWFGLADLEGRVSVFMPYPTIEGKFVGSPSVFRSNPLFTQTWELGVEVLYDPNSLESLPHTNIPDYLSILSQEPAHIWKENPRVGSPVGVGLNVLELSETLEFGKEVVLKTAGISKLLVSPPV